MYFECPLYELQFDMLLEIVSIHVELIVYLYNTMCQYNRLVVFVTNCELSNFNSLQKQ